MKDKVIAFWKSLFPLVSAIVLFCFLTGCTLPTAAISQLQTGAKNQEAKLTIVCTAFPQYDWTVNLISGAEDHVQIRLLNSHGADMHSFQPTAENMVSMAKCDLFIHIGGFSETWVESALKSSGNENAMVLTLLNHVDKKEEAEIKGVAHDHDHDHNHGHSSDETQVHLHDDEDLVEYDEHLWLSLRCAGDSCRAIAKALCDLDPSQADIYQRNLENYLKQLHLMDAQYTDALAHHTEKPLLFADRFPFLYLTEDYGLSYLAAFPGCSAETEASFETILTLSEEMDAHQLHTILILEGSKPELAETVLGNTKDKEGKILVLNSMQSVTAAQIKGGVTYLSIMGKNLDVLKNALE
ncbi:MAG: zinc ABC transporter substrate-binding protein [Firmicutes bacterium]|nr:zinc ABC transporter substrate-binding protein [Bacillota bacterium]